MVRQVRKFVPYGSLTGDLALQIIRARREQLRAAIAAANAEDLDLAITERVLVRLAQPSGDRPGHPISTTTPQI
jgi:hypothetical protein